jgi:hypothetical protein
MLLHPRLPRLFPYLFPPSSLSLSTASSLHGPSRAGKMKKLLNWLFEPKPLIIIDTNTYYMNIVIKYIANDTDKDTDIDIDI